MSTPFQISLAPDQLGRRSIPGPSISRALNSASSTSISAAAGNSDLERKILEKVGSYGRQLGRLGDALEVILRHVKLEDLSSDEQDVLKVLEGQLAQVRQAKADQRASATPKPSSETQTRAR